IGINRQLPAPILLMVYTNILSGVLQLGCGRSNSMDKLYLWHIIVYLLQPVNPPFYTTKEEN
ncbi:MAG TPA: hypothetical protein VMV56_01905, partial [Williamwhitmania sp.]|nr:hypothetical protein [Williamwhitmania sp.]